MAPNRLVQIAQSPRARRLGEFAQSPQAFWRGYKFARSSARNVHQAPEQTSRGQLETWLDAHTTGPGIWKWRHYFPTYERHLAKFRGQEVHILEIGVYSGGSLQMWKEYFGPEARIYGVDIEPVCRQYEDDQTQIFIGDQADKNFWKDVLTKVPRIDIVIDDGGHQTEQQIATLEALLPNMQPGGVFICEDTNGESNRWHSYMDGLSRELHANNRAQEPDPDPRVLPVTNIRATGLQRLVDSIHTYPFMTVIELRANRLERLTSPRCGTEWEPTRTAPWCSELDPWAHVDPASD